MNSGSPFALSLSLPPRSRLVAKSPEGAGSFFFFLRQFYGGGGVGGGGVGDYVFD